MYNELLQLIEENEKNEQNWEKIIESEEGGQINMVKMETLDQKIERKHQKLSRNSQSSSKQQKARNRYKEIFKPF